MALIIGFKLQCTKSIIIYEHINLLSSLDLESLWPDVDGGCLASAMRNNFCVCIFDFLSRFCANAAHWGPGHGVSELHGEGLHDVDDPLEVELVGVVGGVGEEGGAPDDRLRGVKVAIFYPVFLPPLIFCIFFGYSFGILLGRPGGASITKDFLGASR